MALSPDFEKPGIEIQPGEKALRSAIDRATAKAPQPKESYSSGLPVVHKTETSSGPIIISRAHRAGIYSLSVSYPALMESEQSAIPGRGRLNLTDTLSAEFYSNEGERIRAKTPDDNWLAMLANQISASKFEVIGADRRPGDLIQFESRQLPEEIREQKERSA